MDGKTVMIGLLVIVVVFLMLMMTGLLDLSKLTGGGEDTGPTFTRPDITPGREDTTSTGGKQVGDGGSVTAPVDEDRDACQDACDDSCKDDISDCSDDCATQNAGICAGAQLTLNNCNLGCFSIPIKPPGPGPDPRETCFDLCMDGFENACNDADLVDCQNDCQSGQQTCQKDCYGNC